MTVSNPSFLKTQFATTMALGDKAISSDAYFEIEGYEDVGLLIKQFPWPELSPAGEIEVAMPMGQAHWQPQQLKVNQQGQVSVYETTAGHAQNLFQNLIANRGIFNAKVYEGTPENYTRVCPIRQCFMVLDNPDRDWENRGQVLMISGSLFFHYFGDIS